MPQSHASKDCDMDQEKVKKPRLFSGRTFRKQLNQENGLEAIKQFLGALSKSEEHDYVLEYLESGGSCLELLQILELDSTIPPSLVFELVTHVLLRIEASFPQYQSLAFEACRYILNNYVTLLNKMMNLSSTTPERKASLKLLTAMVTLSPTLAKDVLIHINFHSTTVELLTKHTGEKDSVRDHFIKFVTAYLVDGQYPALSILLEKKGFIKSVVSGLLSDSADTLCLVISAMKNHILENPSVSKTTKMKTFNTLVVKDIVNLYNWKGPQSGKTHKTNKNPVVTVDEFEKSKVSECVHDFLLVLCTSHKYGVIFKDQLVGTGKKNQNALMYTVLESLDRPWEHSYASELVTKICGACPDLVKTMWGNLKPFLEPRMSQKWLNALKFSKNLILELKPTCIDYCAENLSVMQLFQIVTCLVSPLPIIKMIVPENNNFESCSVKQNVLSLLSEMLRSVESYMEHFQKLLSAEDYKKLKFNFSIYISKHFPGGVDVLKDWEIVESPAASKMELLEVIFDIFDSYKNLSPALLDSLHSENIDLSKLLKRLDKLSDESENSTLRVKMINTFIDLDSSKFSIESKLFSVVVPLLLKYYYHDTNSNALAVLNKLFKSTGIFDGCSYEINIWINAVSNLKDFDETLPKNLVAILKLTSLNISKYIQEISSMQSENSRTRDYSAIIQNLLDINMASGNKKVLIRHRYLSPMILGLCEYFSQIEVTKSLKIYSSFVLMNLLHMQTQIESIVQIICRNDFSPKSLKDYASCWLECQNVQSLKKLKGKSDIFEQFSEEMLFGKMDDFLKGIETDQYSDLLLNLLDACMFYFCNLSINNSLTNDTFENYQKFVKYVINKQAMTDIFLERLLGHPILLYNVSFLSLDDAIPANFITKFIVIIFKYLLEVGCTLGGYLEVYREKLLSSILKIFKKPHKYNHISSNFREVLQLLGLDYHDCYVILSNLSTSFEKYQNCRIVLDILTYTLNKISTACKRNSDLKPLHEDIIENLTSHFVGSIKHQETELSELSLAFLKYFKMFPHNVKNINPQLFASIVQLKDFNRDNVALATFLLERNNSNFAYVIDNLDSLCEKKGIFLPFLKVLVGKDIDEAKIEYIFEKLEPSLNKVLQKPQKAGQHFHHHYEGLMVLIKKCMPIDKCKIIFGKVQKYEVSEIFHANLLSAVCNKALSGGIDSKNVNSIIMTYVHLQLNLFKRNLKVEEDIPKVQGISSLFNDILHNLKPIIVDKDMKSTSKSESVQLYCKYCLKFGVAGHSIFLKTLTSLLDVLGSFLEEEDGKFIMEMLVSHSEFLEVVLGEDSEVKHEILSLFLVLCQNWDTLMQRNHIPVLLSSYRATTNNCDKVILKLLKMYESKPEQTHFYDFKPFLWGRVAANHYSVRRQIENSLWRQPRMGDVLDILQEDYVLSTLVNYPLKEHLITDDTNVSNQTTNKCYDLMFLLPLFSQLLAPEQQVQTYKFTRSGALSLTVVGLSSEDEEVRKAACHVLARFHYHVDARQSGKDNLLWIRYVEAVCKGTAILPNFKLNNFAAIYLARMALLLTQPNHVMYLPLSQHLTAKSALDFSTVPELYTFLHSCDVNYRDHRRFTLELLKDGLRTEKDLVDFMKSMAFKLVSELFSSSASDLETKLMILDVMLVVCRIPLGVKILCEGHSFLTQIYNLVCIISESKMQDLHRIHSEKIHHILISILRVMEDKHTNLMIFNILRIIPGNNSFEMLTKDSEKLYFEMIYIIENRFPKFISKTYVDSVVSISKDSFSRYLIDYGCEFINVEDLESNCEYFYLRRIVLDFIKNR
ncbi:nucleolar pre-ribosomal-associated protein 1 [Leptinotarsa decemlineata]|uniref:nucleolar pre-ribosomal-associated protein 1 n=1 Tax=Leptinotarsa decemlineata TaxID=7539 RepID=UPI003D307756